MTPAARRKLKEILRQFVEKVLAERSRRTYSIDALKREYPFQSLFFRDEALVAFKHQRRIVTKLGQQLYPQLIVALAQTRYHYVKREFPMLIELDRALWNAIDDIVNRLREAAKNKASEKVSTDHEEAMRHILSVPLSGQTRKHTIVLDIFIADFEPAPLYLELKTPKPNLDICAESKRKILAFEAFMRTEGNAITVDDFAICRLNEKARGYLAFPYGLRETYRHNFTQRIMDMKAEVLIGAELWDMIGGSGTFDELLAVIDEVRNEVPLL
jgi:hypothetical protein